jgi:hypothetical protein
MEWTPCEKNNENKDNPYQKSKGLGECTNKRVILNDGTYP